jgi:uncharacterized protein
MILRIIFYALIGYFIYLLIKFFQGIQKASQRVSSSSQKTGMMVKDSTCNTYLPEEDAIKEKYKGRIYYFCSKKCRDKFLESQKKSSS